MDAPAESSHTQDEELIQEHIEQNQNETNALSIQTPVLSTQSSPQTTTPKSFSLASTLTEPLDDENKKATHGVPQFIIRPSSFHTQLMMQPRSSLQSPMSLIMQDEDLIQEHIGQNQNETNAPSIQTPVLSTQNSPQPTTPKSFSLASTLTEPLDDENKKTIQGVTPLIIQPSSFQTQVMMQPRSSLQSPMSLIMPGLPPSLFLQALNKLTENPAYMTGLNTLKLSMEQNLCEGTYPDGDITPPDSLTSAPPSYSFVLRQMAARRRPRLMGTFIPSPSFVQHTPPPTYATAFDIYINRIPQPTQRVCNFGFTPMPATCPECGYTGMTLVMSRITLCTHISAFILCIFCCWICAPLPYILRSCKDVYHYCRNCRTFLGLYCPTNPDSQL